MTLVIRGLDEKMKRLIRAEAMRRGLKLAQAIKEAFQLWRSFDQDAEVLSEREINNATYSALREELEKYSGKTVLIAGGKFLGTYENPRSAAIDLRRKAPEAHHAIITVIHTDKKEELEWLAGSMNL